MKIRTLIVALVLACQPAVAQIMTEVDAIELRPTYIILPASTNGMVTYRACSGDVCDADFARARLTPDTRFVVNGSGARYADFQQAFSTIRASRKSYALISVDLKSNTVTSIHIQG